MLQMVLNGQNSIKSDVFSIKKDIEKMEERINKKINTLEMRLAKRIDRIGLQAASLEDDTPTIEEFDNLEKRVEKIEKTLLFG